MERLERYSARLRTSVRLFEAEGDGTFDVPAYEALRDAEIVQIADDFAAQERFAALEVLFEAHRTELGPRRLELLREVPETTRVSALMLMSPLARSGPACRPFTCDSNGISRGTLATCVSPASANF